MKKKIIILITIILSGISFTKAQSAGDIDTLSQWRVDNTQAFSKGVSYDHFKYYIEGTIVIDTLKYYKVYKSGYYHWEMWGTPTYYNHVYKGALREEDNKWYSFYNDEDVLLYDFTMELGDTVDSYVTWGADITVTNIDTIQVDGELKKRFHLFCDDGMCAEFIYEDIGASTGLFEFLAWFESFSFLFCYAIDGVSVWGLPTGECDLSVSIKETYQNKSLRAYPNPFTTSTTIEYELKGISNLQFTVYNLQGVVVFEWEEQQAQPGIHKVTWSPSHLPGGMYYAVLRTEEGVGVVKMMKQ